MAEITSGRKGEMLRGLFQILRDLGPEGRLRAGKALKSLENSLTLTPWEQGFLPTGGTRFDKTVRFEILACAKAGWVLTQYSHWSLTEAGKQALEDYPEPKAFYNEAHRLYRLWKAKREVPTPTGHVEVEVPEKEDHSTDDTAKPEASDVRESIQIQAKIAEIGAKMGFRIWVPSSDRVKVLSCITDAAQRGQFLETLPLTYNENTLDTIKEIDVLWLKGQSMARAFEVEHTTAVYSGILRMADLLALQPNMQIRLHIVAPYERREKVILEIKRPVFSLLDHGPLYKKCTFLSYDSIQSIAKEKFLNHMNDSILDTYEEHADKE